MSYCLHPKCLKTNPPQVNYCEHCGAKLLLADRYQAISYLGEGGFGRTFKAIDQNRLNTPCVIKQFLNQKIGTSALSQATELFNQAAEELNELGKHPQIPEVLGFFEQDEQLYLIEEFIEGKNLLQELQERGKFSEADVRIILDEILKILEFAHSKNAIHGDIKPENIIRSPDGSLFLIDFRISKQLSQSILTKMGKVTATPGYAAPEQMQGMIFPASDLYSLGVTCIRLLTGKLPEFSNNSINDELFNVMRMQWVWRNKVSLQDEQLGQVLDRMIAMIVGDRFQSATEVRKELNISQQLQLQPPPQIELKSAREVNYSNLEKMLKAANWKDADRETSEKMLEVARRTKDRWLSVEDINNFPSEDLNTIDQLWVKYSNGRFGFSVQKRLYQSLGGTQNYDEKIWIAFGDLVGWRANNKWFYYAQIRFDISAPEAHLPAYLGVGWGGFGVEINTVWLVWVSLLSREDL